MKTWKPWLLVLPAALGILLAAALQPYSITADNGNFPQAAEAWLSRGSEFPGPFTVEPQSLLDFGKQRLVLAELHDGTDLRLGLFRLERGWNGRYKILHSGYGSGSFRTEVVREGNRACYVLGGRNALFGIRQASFSMKDESLGQQDYQMEIPAGDYFLTAVEINPAFSGDHEEPGSLRLYDGSGQDVTDRANP